MDVATLQYLLKRAQKKRKKSHDEENDYESDNDEDAQDFFLNYGRKATKKMRKLLQQKETKWSNEKTHETGPTSNKRIDKAYGGR